jgi:GNAT superfamily N-acetyltransferase
MDDSRQLVGVCGLYCGACYHYRAAFPDGQHLLDEASRQGRSLDGFTCAGCRSDALYVHPGCSRCEIRSCAAARGVEHCGLCPDLPCSVLSAFRDNGRPHHRDVVENLKSLAVKGTGEWLAEQQERWTCECATRFSWYEESCNSCGATLDSYGRDPARLHGMDGLSLRKATAGDSEFAYRTRKAAFREYVEQASGWDEEEQRLLHERRFTSQDFQVIQVSGIDVGVLATVRESDCVKVKQLFILPEHQGRGIGTACMLGVTEHAAGSGLPVRLRVLKVNSRATAFYQRLGFRGTGESEDHVLMEKLP